MTTSVQNIQAMYAFIERNTNLVKRYWGWELVWMIYSIANSLSVSFIGLGMEALTGQEANIEVINTNLISPEGCTGFSLFINFMLVLLLKFIAIILTKLDFFFH